MVLENNRLLVSRCSIGSNQGTIFFQEMSCERVNYHWYSLLIDFFPFLVEGDMGVCDFAVLLIFIWGVAVKNFPSCGVTVISNSIICNACVSSNFIAVMWGLFIFVVVLLFSGFPLSPSLWYKQTPNVLYLVHFRKHLNRFLLLFLL